MSSDMPSPPRGVRERWRRIESGGREGGLSKEDRKLARRLGLVGVLAFLASFGIQIVMGIVAETDPIRASAASVAACFMTVGVFSGIVRKSGGHSLMGLYSGIAAGVASCPFTWLAVGLSPYVTDWASAILSMAIVLLGYAVAYVLFGALIAAAERKPGNAAKGAMAGIAWFGRIFAWSLGLVFAFWALFFLLASVGVLGVVLGTTSTIVMLLTMLYIHYRATRRFFLNLKAQGIFWPRPPAPPEPVASLVAEDGAVTDEGETNGIDPRS